MHVLSVKRREVIDMIQLAAGIILGILFTAVVAAMVGCCIHMEKKYPEIRDKYLSETER